MQIIYMHHAERKIGENHQDSKLRQLEDITERGIKQAEVIAKRFKNKNIKAIYTSPYERCKHTASIMNKYHKVPIIEDERFNEMEWKEEWQHLLTRNMQAIDDIVKKYDKDDVIICVTSGVNFSAFVCYFYKLEASNEIPWTQAGDISPIIFNLDKSDVD